MHASFCKIHEKDWLAKTLSLLPRGKNEELQAVGSNLRAVILLPYQLRHCHLSKFREFIAVYE